MAPSDPGLSLYVHVPFCTDKCLYCDFYSVPRGSLSKGVQTAVVDQTIEQAKKLLAAAAAPRVQTIFFGGGTPSVLERPALKKLLMAFSDLRPDEWTVEANPETLDDSFLTLCSDAGVTRLSVGIQTLQPRLLELLRRRATPQDSHAAADLLRRTWGGRVSLDFIAGIPGQTTTELSSDLDLLDGDWPGHVSLYQLTTEPGTPLARLVQRGEIELNTAELDEELWFAGRDALESLGYSQYEVSNFSVPGKEVRHNLRYWGIEPYIGVGPAAVSTVPADVARRAFGSRAQVAPEATVVRLSNPKDIERFMTGSDGLWGCEVEEISPRDFLLETLMMGLRVAGGIPVESFIHKFAAPVTRLLPGLWEGWMKRGWAEPLEGARSDGAMRLTRAGLMLLDHLLAEAAARIAGEELPDLAVQWP